MSELYPGFTLKQFFNHDAIPILLHQSTTQQSIFSNGTVDFVYNAYGYRTHEFVNIDKNYILISGCSLTEGHGLHLNQTWGYMLEKSANLSVFNLAKGSSNAEFVSQNLINWLSSGHYHIPKIIVVQWPNPFRAIHWQNERAIFVVNRSADSLFNLKVKHGQEHFYTVWINSIVNLNRICRQLRIPILNLCFEEPSSINLALNILQQYQVELHLDQKLPNQTWHFDNAALDSAHHSEWCTQQWATRILTLMNNML